MTIARHRCYQERADAREVSCRQLKGKLCLTGNNMRDVSVIGNPQPREGRGKVGYAFMPLDQHFPPNIRPRNVRLPPERQKPSFAGASQQPHSDDPSNLRQITN